MYCGQASVLSISKKKKKEDQKLHKQATDNVIDKPELIFIGNSLKYFIVIHINFGPYSRILLTLVLFEKVLLIDIFPAKVGNPEKCEICL